MKPEASYTFISANQKSQYQINNPFFAIDERNVTCNWPCRNLHWHECFEIEIVLSGKGTYIYDNVEFPIHEKCAYLLAPADIHALIPNCENDLHLLHFRFDGQTVPEEIQSLLLKHKYSYPVEFDDEDFQHLLFLIQELIHFFEQKNTAFDLQIRLLFSCICLQIIQKFDLNTMHFSTINTNNTIIHQTILYIFSHFQKKISMKELGEVVHVSPNHLAMLFKKHTGSTCMKFVSDLRMQQAIKLLKTKSLSIEQICEKTGFSSVSYFISLFRKQFGITPKEYQKNH